MQLQNTRRFWLEPLKHAFRHLQSRWLLLGCMEVPRPIAVATVMGNAGRELPQHFVFTCLLSGLFNERALRLLKLKTVL